MEEFMIFLCVAAIIILIIRINALKKRTESLEQEIRTSKTQLRDLYDKSFFMYDLLSDMGAAPGRKKNAPPVSESASRTNTAQYSASIPNDQPVAAPDAAYTAARSEVSAPTSGVTLEKMPQTDGGSTSSDTVYQAAAAPVESVSRTTAAPASEPAQQIPVSENAPYTPYAASQVTHAPQIRKQPKRNIEEWLGARVFNIAASVLIFIGLVLFCTLGTDKVTNTVKMTAMFAVSGGFIGVGAFLSRKDRSTLPLGMLGTGFGAFFISILLSHVYFHSLGDIAAFGLILVWSVFALFLSKKLDSVMLSVTAHIGTAVSICFAFSLGFTADRVILLTIYQLAALAVIIIGNIFCCRRTYRFGLIMSQALLLYTSIAMSHAFSEKFIMPEAISVPFAILIYAIQFAAISFVSHLVSTSAAALEREGGKLTAAAPAVQFVNKLLWTAGTVSSVGMIAYYIAKNAYHTDPTLSIVITLAAAAILHLAITMFMEEKLRFSEGLSTISLWFLSLLFAAAVFIGAHTTGLPYLFIYALLLIGIFKLTKHKGLVPLTAALLLIEALYMTFYGYFKAENVWASIPYMFAMGVVLLLLWFAQNPADKQRYFKYMKISEYIWISVSIISINASEFSEISIPLIISEFALMNIICYFIKFGGENEPELRTVVKAESLLTVYIGILSLAFEESNSLGDNNIIKAVLVFMVAFISCVYIYDFARSKITALQTAAALTAASYFTALAFGFQDHFRIFDIYAYTLSCKPFIFVFAVSLLIIYSLTKNHKLAKFVWIGVILDMLLMGFDGYSALVDEAVYGGDVHSIPMHIIMTGISLAHASIMLGASFLMNNLIEEDSHASNAMRSLSRYVSYFWINLSFPTIAYCALYETKLSDYKMIFALILLVIVNTAVFALRYQGEPNTPFNYTVRITSALVFYSSLPFLSQGRHGKTGEYAACVILMLLLCALFFVKTRDLLRYSRDIWAQVYTGISATILVNFICNGLTSSYDFTYVFSIITMLTSLLCITAGYIARAKGLRVYGLIVTMICIIKLVTVDISGADSLARVLAFIIGGVICFIISGIYNMMEKKFSISDAPMQKVTVGAPAQQIGAVQYTVSEPANVNIPKETAAENDSKDNSASESTPESQTISESSNNAE